MDMYSTRFRECQVVYPHTITRPVDKYKLNPRPFLDNFISDISDNSSYMIKVFVGDNLKRAQVREALNHASLYACEYCFQKANSLQLSSKQTELKKKELTVQINVIEQKISYMEELDEIDQEELATLRSIKDCLCSSLKDLDKTKKKVCWPSSTSGGEPRTTEKIQDIVAALEENPKLPPDEAKGIVGKSPLLNLPQFDMVRNVPAEYLHSVCIGVVKRMVELTFNVGVTRNRVTKRKLSPPHLLNEQIRNMKLPFECSRRARSLDFSVWKGQEFRNLILFFFPLVINCIERNAKERRLWLLLAFMIRACVLPSEEFHKVNLDELEYCCQEFYKLYEQLFGASNCSYNTHVVGSHLIEIRCHGPLTLTSAFGFESFYGEVRQSFCPGTVSPLKQIMEKVLLKRALGPHTCKQKMTLTTHETSLECNNLVYTFENRRYSLYKIIEIQEDEQMLKCVKISTRKKKFVDAFTLNWESVGVFELQSITDDIVEIDMSSVAGKIVKCNNILLTCPKNVLEEK